jgi:hypothetical protein
VTGVAGGIKVEVQYSALRRAPLIGRFVSLGAVRREFPEKVVKAVSIPKRIKAFEKLGIHQCAEALLGLLWSSAVAGTCHRYVDIWSRVEPQQTEQSLFGWRQELIRPG